MTQNECLHGYFSVMNQTVCGYGVPLSAYSDKHTIFRSPLTEKKAELGEEANLTQFGRALHELGIELKYAHSPQAKGRIERLWGTLQSRLPVEFALRGIASIEEANLFLAQEYILMFNARFAVAAEGPSIFIPYTHSERLDDILCIKEQRKADTAGSFSFKGQRFKILDEGYPLVPPKAAIEILVNVNDAIRVRYAGRVFPTQVTTAIEKPKAKPQKVRRAESLVKPHLLHGSDEWKKVWHYENYAESLAFLYELFFKTAA